MKRFNYLVLVVALLSVTVACNKVSFKKTKSGLAYKIFSGNGKDSLIKAGNIVKYNVIYKLNEDSVLYTSYGKAPQFTVVQDPPPAYNMFEVFPMMRKGDSAQAVLMLDTLVKQGAQLPFTPKKGDRVVISFKIIEVFKSDSVARADYNREMEKDRPRMEKEQAEQMAKLQKEQEEQRQKEEEEMEKSGEVAKELKEMEAWLAAKKINAQKTGKGTYVVIREQGTGPQAANNKYLNVKYTGKILATDSVFQSYTYPFQLGKGAVIRGWDEGLLLFKEGGKGTLYVPGFLAYGKNPGPGGKPFEALAFDVEVLKVSDSTLAPPPPPHQ